jgi:phosphohistidine phosphatase
MNPIGPQQNGKFLVPASLKASATTARSSHCEGIIATESSPGCDGSATRSSLEQGPRGRAFPCQIRCQGVAPDSIAPANGQVLSFGAPTSAETSMVELYLVRHGIALEETGAPDAWRPLSGKGRRRFQKTARAFGRLGRKLDLILTSPLVRAVQTAEILAGETRHGEVEVLKELDPAVGTAELLEALAKRLGKAKAVALVGHEPQLSSVLATLCGVSQDDLDLKKGAIVRLDLTALPRPTSVAPRWWLKPRAGARVKGLPLKRTGRSEEAEASTIAHGNRKRAKGPSPRRRTRSARPRRAQAAAGVGAPEADSVPPPVNPGPTAMPLPEDGAAPSSSTP